MIQSEITQEGIDAHLRQIDMRDIRNDPSWQQDQAEDMRVFRLVEYGKAPKLGRSASEIMASWPDEPTPNAARLNGGTVQ